MVVATKRVNIFLKDKVHTEAKVVSVIKKTTLTRFLEKAISDTVQSDEQVIRELVK